MNALVKESSCLKLLNRIENKQTKLTLGDKEFIWPWMTLIPRIWLLKPTLPCDFATARVTVVLKRIQINVSNNIAQIKAIFLHKT